MPAAARKSSLGASRRAAEKKHIPFRADELGRGKKTGMAVHYVDHKSDEFEPFEQIMSQADMRTPPRARNGVGGRGRKKSTARAVETVVEDEDGEMSMELDDSGFDAGAPESASAYFQNTRKAPAPASVARRSVPRASEVDFDSIPSPRPRSAVNGRRSSAYTAYSSAGPSHSRTSLGLDYEEEDVPVDEGGDYDEPQYDDQEQYAEEEQEALPSRSYRATPRRASFTEMAEESEQEEDARSAANHSRAKDKGKGRLIQDEQDAEDVEEEIAQGLDDIGMDEDGYPEDGPQPEPESQPDPPKKKRKSADGQPKPRAKKKPALTLSTSMEDENADGLRRGKRIRYAPLEWWRQEKVVYGRRESGVSFVPTIKAIVRIPKEAPKPLGKHGKVKNSRSKSKTVDEQMLQAYNPEEGWDNDTSPMGVVNDWLTGDEVERRLAFPGRLVSPRAGANNDFYFQKIFGDGEYIAAGQLMIPPKGHKPTKMTKDNTYVFYVIEGAVNFKVHNSSYVLCTGGMILVPRGNTYYIENICDRDAKLFFSQARRVSGDDEKPQERLQRSTSASASVPRRMSVESAGPSAGPGPGPGKKRGASKAKA